MATATASRPRYKFVRGAGDSAQENKLHQAAMEGYKATMMIYDEASGRANSQGVVVLMENED
jgi:hypothetical protein